MPVYRIYILTDKDLIAAVQEIDCDDDAAAIAMAEALRSEYPWIEIWYADRMVRRWLPPANDN
jgi:hypothetical protein